MSTIKVDTYLTRGGASEIAIDKLKGVTAAGSMLVVGEGGTNTTNLQQGLCKAWIHLDGKGSDGVRDSFNVSGITDNGTGDYTTSFSNNLSNDDYCATGMCTFTVGATPRYRIISGYVWATSSIRVITGYSDTNASDHAVVGINIAGDLA